MPDLYVSNLMLDYFKGKRILVVAAHPDDEVLGPGASLYKLIHTCHCKARVVILGEGLTSRADKREPAAWATALEEHRRNIEAAAQVIGYTSTGLYDLPDNRFDSVDLLDIVKIVEKEKQAFDPDIIFTHHGGDVNVDHQRTFEAVLTASRPLQAERVKTLLTFEVASSTEWQAFNHATPFRPNLFIRVSEEDLQAKIQAMGCYTYETRSFPHPRSAEALRIQAARRGVEIGSAFAEAFVLIRSIV